jgi:hypothetical protein
MTPEEEKIWKDAADTKLTWVKAEPDYQDLYFKLLEKFTDIAFRYCDLSDRVTKSGVE